MLIEEENVNLGEIEVSIHNTREEMLHFVPQWAGLWESCPNATPFQHPSWAVAWWRFFGRDKQLAIIVLKDQGKAVGVAPVCFLDEKEQRKCMFVGAGLSDSMDLLVKCKFRSLLGRTLLAWLQNEDWTECDLQPLPPSSWLLAGARSLLLTYSIESLEPNTILHLPGSWDEFEKRYSPHFRERIRDAERKLKSFGEVRFEQHESGAEEGVLEALLEFRRKRWEPEANTEDWGQLKGFFQEALDGCRKRGELRVYSLKINGVIAAGLCGFLCRGRAYFYLMGFDDKYAAASPGRLLLWRCLHALVEEGACLCDFLRGREEFKCRWGVVEVPHYGLRITLVP